MVIVTHNKQHKLIIKGQYDLLKDRDIQMVLYQALGIDKEMWG